MAGEEKTQQQARAGCGGVRAWTGRKRTGADGGFHDGRRGGYYHFKYHPGQQFLFCYGHSVAGQTENYAYVGMYWTWGKDTDDKKERPSEGYSPGPLNRSAF